MYLGNNTKSLHISVRDSLEKLRTTYIDLLYVHWWDYETSIEEVMRSLHTLVQAGKVLYLVISLDIWYSVPITYAHFFVGSLRYAGLGRLPGKSICARSCFDAFQCLPRRLECHVPRHRAGNYPNGAC